jgi:hypothetical protein
MDHSPSKRVPFRDVQIIVSALILGVSLFAVIALVNTWKKAPADPLFSYVMAALVVPMVVGGTIFERVMMATALQNLPPAWAEDKLMRLFAQFKIRAIIRNASLEGAAFANLVVYMVTAQWLSVAVGAAIVAVMLVGFPTTSRFDEWIRRRSENAQFESQ